MGACIHWVHDMVNTHITGHHTPSHHNSMWHGSALQHALHPTLSEERRTRIALERIENERVSVLVCVPKRERERESLERRTKTIAHVV